jgi:hypothetical protein
MTKPEAIQEIIWDSNNVRPSKASLSRCRKAGKALDLSETEQRDLEVFLDYRKHTTFELYGKFE